MAGNALDMRDRVGGLVDRMDVSAVNNGFTSAHVRSTHIVSSMTIVMQNVSDNHQRGHFLLGVTCPASIDTVFL